MVHRLTVEISTPEARKYWCAGTGCPKIFKPQTTIHVLKHCKQCLKMTSEQRKVAATHTAPGALVANTLAQLAANELTTPSTTGPKRRVRCHLGFGECFFLKKNSWYFDANMYYCMYSLYSTYYTIVRVWESYDAIIVSFYIK